ncbi:MAG: DUF1284 domain-containing protein [Candidatus Aenigmarchaeota archaeon]|nr:DUF1284 domain-containing protein [Candidatus Aenigmarchaeota archaeon]
MANYVTTLKYCEIEGSVTVTNRYDFACPTCQDRASCDKRGVPAFDDEVMGKLGLSSGQPYRLHDLLQLAHDYGQEELERLKSIS